MAIILEGEVTSAEIVGSKPFSVGLDEIKEVPYIELKIRDGSGKEHIQYMFMEVGEGGLIPEEIMEQNVSLERGIRKIGGHAYALQRLFIRSGRHAGTEYRARIGATA
jgi:hypothetical protein